MTSDGTHRELVTFGLMSWSIRLIPTERLYISLAFRASSLPPTERSFQKLRTALPHALLLPVMKCVARLFRIVIRGNKCSVIHNLRLLSHFALPLPLPRPSLLTCHLRHIFCTSSAFHNSALLGKLASISEAGDLLSSRCSADSIRGSSFSFFRSRRHHFATDIYIVEYTQLLLRAYTADQIGSRLG